MRYKRVRLSGIFMARMFTNGKFPRVTVSNGLPEGARFVYAIPDSYYGVYIVIEHDSFPELKDGDLIPELDPPICEVIEDGPISRTPTR